MVSGHWVIERERERRGGNQAQERRRGGEGAQMVVGVEEMGNFSLDHVCVSCCVGLRLRSC